MLMDVNANINRDNELDLPDLEWLAREENAHPLEYYLNQENNSNKSKDKDEDYSNGSLLLLDIIKGNFY
jgi:MoaA/NifB/PqqE/SkfB family radical SAM enzyme